MQEPGDAGVRFADAFRHSRRAPRTRAIRLGARKGLSELHLAVNGDRDTFLAKLLAAVDAGEPLRPATPEPKIVTEPVIVTEPHSWLERASDLLAEPDPRPNTVPC